MSADPNIVKLLDHSRKISRDMMKYAFEFTEDIREKAESTLNYGKKVKKSLENLIGKDLKGEYEGQNIFMVTFVSILPQLDNAISELSSTLSAKHESSNGDDVLSEEELEAMIMQNYQRVEQEMKEKNENTDDLK